MTDTESLASTTVSIFLEKASSETRYIYKVFLKDEAGAPVPHENVDLTIEGDGSFSPGFHSHETKRDTDDAGVAQFTWFRRSVFLRDVKSQITATATKPGRTIALEVSDEKPPSVEISWAKEEIRLPPRRV